MAGEDALAEHVEAVLPKLVDVGATGALLWCFADYAESCGIGRRAIPRGDPRTPFRAGAPDGTLKPHADVVRRFAATASERANHPDARSTWTSAPMSTTPTHLDTPDGSTTLFLEASAADR